MSSLGVNVSRVDGPAKIRGAAQYTADVEIPGMVYAKGAAQHVSACQAGVG
jgi:CO/xanthine dehydrogenase Mo-binding subunit